MKISVWGTVLAVFIALLAVPAAEACLFKKKAVVQEKSLKKQSGPAPIIVPLKSASSLKGRPGRGGGDWGRGRPNWRPGWGPHVNRHVTVYKDGSSFWAPVIGGLAGYVIGQGLRNQAAPPPPDDEKEVETQAIVLEPWTAQWYEYCATKFNTFDAKTGTYTDTAGQKKFCQ
jgi:hypothetical protein